MEEMLPPAAKNTLPYDRRKALRCINFQPGNPQRSFGASAIARVPMGTSRAKMPGTVARRAAFLPGVYEAWTGPVKAITFDGFYCFCNKIGWQSTKTAAANPEKKAVEAGNEKS